MVWMKFREFWAKGSSGKRILLRVVHIARGEEVDDGKQYSGQKRKRLWEQILDNIKITNPTFRRAYNKKTIILGRIQQRYISGRCACLENGKHKRGRYRER